MDTQASLVESINSPKKKVLFLGYTRNQTSLVDELVKARCEVWHTQEKIESTAGYDFVVSYGYRHILKKNVIGSSHAPIINLHISYLPWNRGAHPNFWSFYDRTPSGVSIHLIDEGVDTGPIIYQRYVTFNEHENTFLKTYNRLISEIEILFKENISDIIENTFVATPQHGRGTYHSVADLPKEFNGWDSDISAEVARLSAILKDD